VGRRRVASERGRFCSSGASKGILPTSEERLEEGTGRPLGERGVKRGYDLVFTGRGKWPVGEPSSFGEMASGRKKKAFVTATLGMGKGSEKPVSRPSSGISAKGSPLQKDRDLPASESDGELLCSGERRGQPLR